PRPASARLGGRQSFEAERRWHELVLGGERRERRRRTGAAPRRWTSALIGSPRWANALPPSATTTRRTPRPRPGPASLRRLHRAHDGRRGLDADAADDRHGDAALGEQGPRDAAEDD